jgi:DNA-binding Lrp family transcriptional regulator
LNAFAADPSITQAQIAKELSLSEKQVRLVIKKLLEHGRIVRVNGKRYGRWEILCQTQEDDD